MKLFGHPLHVMLIHFPVALLPMDAALSWLYYLRGTESLGHAAYYAALGGGITGFIAIVSGVMDLLVIPRSHKAAWAGALIHGLVNGIVVLIYAGLLYKVSAQYPVLSPPTTAVLIIKTILIITLFGGNYLGGSLVYKHGIGAETKTIQT
jgi:uncharacterized membrane protein